MEPEVEERVPRSISILDYKRRVRIILNDTSRVHHVGDHFSGTVRITSATEVHIGKLVITFSGVAKTESLSLCVFGGSISLHKGQALLFQNQSDLFTGPYTLKPGTHEWPFTFTFPQTCLPRRDIVETDSKTYEVDQSVGLLPCFTWEAHTTPTLKAKCSVACTLTASLADGRGQAREKRLDLRFRPYPPRGTTAVQRSASIVRKSFSCKSYRLNSPSLNRDPTLMEKFKTSVATTDLPYATFDLTLTVPAIGKTGQPLKMNLTLQHNTERTNALAPPRITLTSLSLSIEPKTTTRTWITGRGSQFPRPDKPARWGHQLSCSGKPEYLIDTKCSLPIRQSLNLNDHFELVIPAEQVPSFRSTNIERTYALYFQAEVECASINFKFPHRVSDFVILSGEEAPGDRLQELQELATTLSGTLFLIDELPPYVA